MRLSTAEFDRRYFLRTDLPKVEFLYGVVYVPLSISRHSDREGLLSAWLTNYQVSHPDTVSAPNGTVFLSADHRVQPDGMLFFRNGGSGRIGQDDYLHGPPELVAEVAATSADYDAGPKFRAYEEAGVQEYVLWLVDGGAIHWYALEDGRYTELPPAADGWTYSRVFSGLRLHIRRLLAGDRAVILPEAR
jgi:Uma2 family endonuclease